MYRINLGTSSELFLEEATSKSKLTLFMPFCRYQGHISAALVLGGVDFTGPHLFTVSFEPSWMTILTSSLLPPACLAIPSTQRLFPGPPKWGREAFVCLPQAFAIHLQGACLAHRILTTTQNVAYAWKRARLWQSPRSFFGLHPENKDLGASNSQIAPGALH